MSEDNMKNYDMTHDEYLYHQAKGVVSEMDNLLQHYKLAESMYSYKNLEGENNVSTFLFNKNREVNNRSDKIKEHLEKG